ncbi:MAG TPA: hypothetical protein VMW66_04060 [Elusimicrobiales bacterium]|nr:hypothetical protein [Elusimicrobiales bacterium]
MRKLTLVSTAIFSTFVLVVLFGCSGKQKLTDGPIAVKAPAWVNQGSGAFEDADNKKIFYGVGMISGIKDRSLSIHAADQRARAKIAETLENYIVILTKDYMVSTSSVDMAAPAEEQDVSVALKGFTKMTLKGAAIVDHWRDPSDETMFSLARLELDDFKKDMDNSQEVEDKLRDFVRNNSDKAFDELAQVESMQ